MNGRLRTLLRRRPFGEAGLGATAGAAAGLFFHALGLQGLASIWWGAPAFVVAGAVAGALLWRGRGRGLVIGSMIALEALYLLVAFSPVSRWLTTGLARHDREAPADAIYVFASSIQVDGDLTTHAMTRLIHGLELLGEGKAPRLIVGELPPPFRSYRAAAEKMMVNLGLARETIGIGPVTNTHDECVLLAKLFKERGWTRVLAVTSPTHSARASRSLEAQSLIVEASPSTETGFDLETLDGAQDRVEAFREAIHERLGLFVYRLRGWVRE